MIFKPKHTFSYFFMPRFFSFKNLDYISKKAVRFKYLCCSMFGDNIAFGTSSGSIHIYKSCSEDPPIVISIGIIENEIYFLSFSPTGSSIIAADSEGIYIIDSPFGNASLLFSIETNQKRIVSGCWIVDHLTKNNRSVPFFIFGDENGSICGIKQQEITNIHQLKSKVIQIQFYGKFFLISTLNHSYLMSHTYEVTMIKTKRPIGEYGGVYSESFDAICFSRPAGNLLIASPQGKPKALIDLIKDYVFEKSNSKLCNDLGRMYMCSEFLISIGNGLYGYIINLKEAKIVYSFSDESEFLDCSVSNNQAVILWKNSVVLFKVADDDDAFLVSLYTQGEKEQAWRLAISNNIKSIETLKKLLPEITDEKSAPFIEYFSKIQLEVLPNPLQKSRPDLYEKLCAGNEPTPDVMENIYSILHLVVMDDVTKERINRYVLKYPRDWLRWSIYLDVDRLVPVLNSSEEFSQYAMEMAKKGKSYLCLVLSRINAYPVPFLVANSPPIYSYNLSGNQRIEFEKLIQQDMFQTNIFLNDCVNDANYSEKLIEDCINELTEEKLTKILHTKDWEDKLFDCIEEISDSLLEFKKSQGEKSIPTWIEALISQESKQRIQYDVKKTESEGHWGIIVDQTTCDNCGMALAFNDYRSSICVFPCSHSFHSNCIKTKHCPICCNSGIQSDY